MITLLRLTALFFVTSWALSSCELVGETNLDEPGAIENLTQTWGVDSAFIDGLYDYVTDYSLFQLTINDNNTYELTDQNGETFSGNWSLVSNESRLSLENSSGNTQTYTILVLDEDELIVVTQTTAFKDQAVDLELQLKPI
jgi:maltodextrin utilization protein YvdJ